MSSGFDISELTTKDIEKTAKERPIQKINNKEKKKRRIILGFSIVFLLVIFFGLKDIKSIISGIRFAKSRRKTHQEAINYIENDISKIRKELKEEENNYQKKLEIQQKRENNTKVVEGINNNLKREIHSLNNNKNNLILKHTELVKLNNELTMKKNSLNNSKGHLHRIPIRGRGHMLWEK